MQKEKLTHAIVMRMLADGYKQKEIAALFGTQQAHVSRLKNNRQRSATIRRGERGGTVAALLERLATRED